MTSLVMAMPCGGPVDPRVLQSVSNLCFATALSGVQAQLVSPRMEDFQFGITNRTVIQSARNWLADAFLKTGADWCFWMDSDMTFPATAAVQLLKAAKEIPGARILSGVYYQRAGEKLPPCPSCGHQKSTHKPAVWRQDPIVKGRDGTEIVRPYEDEYLHHFIVPSEVRRNFKAHVVGFGCVLTHRSVFEEMERPWFRFLPLAGGKEASEDFYFFVNAKKAGIDLWVVPSVSCGHIGEAPIITEADCIVDRSKMVQIQLETAADNAPRYQLVEATE